MSERKDAAHAAQLETESLQRQLKDTQDRLAESSKVRGVRGSTCSRTVILTFASPHPPRPTTFSRGAGD